jgi:hypothetical protein
MIVIKRQMHWAVSEPHSTSPECPYAQGLKAFGIKSPILTRLQRPSSAIWQSIIAPS